MPLSLISRGPTEQEQARVASAVADGHTVQRLALDHIHRPIEQTSDEVPNAAMLPHTDHGLRIDLDHDVDIATGQQRIRNRKSRKKRKMPRRQSGHRNTGQLPRRALPLRVLRVLRFHSSSHGPRSKRRAWPTVLRSTGQCPTLPRCFHDQPSSRRGRGPNIDGVHDATA
jgi:hypothetical protein